MQFTYLQNKPLRCPETEIECFDGFFEMVFRN